MRMNFQNVLIGFIGLSFTGCSWLVNLVVANTSINEIKVRYAIPSDAVASQFYRHPKTYVFNEKLLKLYKSKAGTKPVDIPTDLTLIVETNEIEIKIKPGQAVHVGYYLSFQPRHEIVSNNGLRIITANDSTLNSQKINEQFRHWCNIHTDVVELN